jgi:GTP-binding protein
MLIKSSIFVVSSTDIRKCPKPNRPEYAFLGRSNVGKSSLINMLTGIRNLARTSSVPGKTQLINHYLINDEWYLVDLPGLGYAKVSRGVKQAWQKMITRYLLSRTNLMNIFFLVDARLEPQAIDIAFVNWMGSQYLPFTLVFTKTDKISRMLLSEHMKSFNEQLSETWETLPHSIVTSSVERTGREEILLEIERANRVFYSPEEA